MSLIENFQFGLPYALLAFPLALLALVWAYRRKGRGQKVIMSSLLLLKMLQQERKARQKFSPPLRFLLELLLFLLLSLAAANLYQKSAANSFAVVLDNSFSSLARFQDSTRLARLKLALLDNLSNLESGSQIDLYAYTVGLQKLNSNPLSPEQARRLAIDIIGSFSEDNLGLSIEQLSGNSNYDKVLVFTDKPLAETTGSTSRNVSIRNLNELQTGPANNLSFSDIRWKNSNSSKAVEVDLMSYSSREAAARIILDCLTTENKIETMGTQTVNLPAQQNAAVLFELGDKPVAQCRATLQVDQENDLIAEDNTIYIATRLNGSLFVVHSDLSLEQLGLKSIPGYDFIKAESFQATEQRDKQISYLYHRQLPEQAIKANQLVILPPVDNTSVPVKELSGAVNITSWLQAHPLMSYLDASALAIKSGSAFTTQPGLEAVLSSNAGPLIVVRDLPDSRSIYLGFEIFPFEAQDNPALTILTINSLKWLSGAVSSNYYPAGGVLPIAAGSKVKYLTAPVGLVGEVIEQTAGWVATTPGLVKVASKEVKDQVLAVNFINAKESNLQTVEQLALPAERLQAQGSSQIEYWRPLLLLLLAFLLIDLGFNFYRSMRKRQNKTQGVVA